MNFPALFHHVIQSGYLLEHLPKQWASYSHRLPSKSKRITPNRHAAGNAALRLILVTIRFQSPLPNSHPYPLRRGAMPIHVHPQLPNCAQTTILRPLHRARPRLAFLTEQAAILSVLIFYKYPTPQDHPIRKVSHPAPQYLIQRQFPSRRLQQG